MTYNECLRTYQILGLKPQDALCVWPASGAARGGPYTRRQGPPSRTNAMLEPSAVLPTTVGGSGTASGNPQARKATSKLVDRAIHFSYLKKGELPLGI
jgi:hypothetical protein